MRVSALVDDPWYECPVVLIETSICFEDAKLSAFESWVVEEQKEKEIYHQRIVSL